MNRFAHMADVHLGAHREGTLKELEMRSFNAAMDRCMKTGVDFILISGDLFHVGIPDLTMVNESIKKIREVREAKIPIYVIYGSHDYTPTSTSIIDILDTAGLLTKVMRYELSEDRLRLEFLNDPKTGAKLTGISARRIGLESKNYEILDKKSLEDEEGFRIFAFHSGITEFKPEYLSQMETISISYFPRGLDYYAGGHIHERGEYSLPGYERVVFPGPLFTGYGRDVETTARGEKRGFYIVEFDEKVRRVQFVENETFPGSFIEVEADGKNSVQVGNELDDAVRGKDVDGRVVVLKVRGELSGGKTSDIDFAKLRSRLMESGALYVYINRYGLTSKEFAVPTLGGEDPATIERNLFSQRIQNVHVSSNALKGEPGAALARELLKSLRVESSQGESKREYVDRMLEGGVQTLNIGQMFDEVEEE